MGADHPASAADALHGLDEEAWPGTLLVGPPFPCFTFFSRGEQGCGQGQGDVCQIFGPRLWQQASQRQRRSQGANLSLCLSGLFLTDERGATAVLSAICFGALIMRGGWIVR